MLPSGKEVKVLNPVGTFAFSLMDGKHAPEDIAQIELILRDDVAVGGPAPEAMPKELAR